MSLISWSPFLDLDGFDRMLDRLPVSSGSGSGLIPAVNIIDKKDAVLIEAALPGVQPGDVDISVERGVLIIKGSSERKTEVDETDYYRKEIRSGTFMRQISLPQGVDEAKAKAAFKDGMLTVTIPKEKREPKKSIKIDVQAS